MSANLCFPKHSYSARIFFSADLYFPKLSLSFVVTAASAAVSLQYDDREVDVGGGGGRGSDFETVRRVNQLVRQEEEEDAWWENNKNTNLRLVSHRSHITSSDARVSMRPSWAFFFFVITTLLGVTE